jgi:hypothetical protein
MSFQIDTALVNAYNSNINIKFQQKGSRLRPYVRQESQNSEFDFFDRIGPTAAVKVKNRHADTPLISTPHDRRRNATEDYDWADLIDKQDKLRMLADPTSAYATNAVYAFGRSMDVEIVRAAFGTAYSGKTGQTSIPFPASQVIAVNYSDTGGSANTNLTLDKLRKIRLMFDLEEAVDWDAAEELYMAVTAWQINSMLRQDKMTDIDTAAVKALVNGTIDTFMGIKFIRVHPSIIPKSGDERACPVWTRQGILLGTADEVNTDVGPRRDKRNSVQVYCCASFGATRMWEEQVVKVLCDETK